MRVSCTNRTAVTVCKNSTKNTHRWQNGGTAGSIDINSVAGTSDYGPTDFCTPSVWVHLCVRGGGVVESG